MNLTFWIFFESFPKEMRGNPINLILFSIAVADILLMLEYIPFTVHMYILMQNVDREREDKVSAL